MPCSTTNQTGVLKYHTNTCLFFGHYLTADEGDITTQTRAWSSPRTNNERNVCLIMLNYHVFWCGINWTADEEAVLCGTPGPNNETNSCFLNVKWARACAAVIVKHHSDMREVRTREWTSASLHFSCCAHQALAIRGTDTNNNWNTTSQGLKACSLCCPVYFRLVIGSRGVIVRYWYSSGQL